MKEEEIKFKCPECEGTVLTKTTTGVEVVEVVDALRVVDGVVGNKFNIVPGFRSVSDGKPSKFSCQACGYVLHGKSRESYRGFSFRGRKLPTLPIKSAKQLHDWLKRNKEKPAEK